MHAEKKLHRATPPPRIKRRIEGESARSKNRLPPTRQKHGQSETHISTAPRHRHNSLTEITMENFDAKKWRE